MQTLQRQIFVFSLGLSFFLLLIFVMIGCPVLYRYEFSKGEIFLQQRTHVLANYIDGFFSKYIVIIDYLSRHPQVIKAYKASDREKREVLKTFYLFNQIDPTIKYIYAGYKDDSLLIYNYDTPKEYKSTQRPWYKEAVKSSPKISEGVVYPEFVTKEWLVALGKTLVNENGEIVGVIAIDSSLENLLKIFRKKLGPYATAYSFVIKKDGTVIIHPDETFLGKKLEILPLREFLFNPEGKVEFSQEGITKIAYYKRLENLNWILITVVDKSELLKPLFITTGLMVLLVGFLAFGLGWFVSYWLTKHIIFPINILKDNLLMLSQGFEIPENLKKYPENEIGIIAKEVEKLASSELLKKNIELEKLTERLKFLAERDFLTQLFNRFKLIEELKKEINRYERFHIPFSIILFDIDDFKRINDNYGHDKGDYVLKELARLMKENLRETDLPARWGGEEFVILCPNTTKEKAWFLAERIRKAVEGHKFEGIDKLTISGGVVEYRSGIDLPQLLKEVDEKLYQAKKSGKNQIVS
ncbi:diguanylate cyclase [Thermodesulfobacterium sp. TA1]|uniref:sensor domain-containing diguanylate cyclase n=1 Tax=Thermodesulfobacterium sp. TA1 TaxID=2234087 RepID=UPI0012328A90|nr:sensor domain-containing diguanylate cyclase [Thermodesulfobacterium sp. TA1]QER41198.1 diguanylate cyclase [Thermodesulfobacterium sp. TA1]